MGKNLSRRNKERNVADRSLDDVDRRLLDGFTIIMNEVQHLINEIEVSDDDNLTKCRRSLLVHANLSASLGLDWRHHERLQYVINALSDAQAGLSHPLTAPRNPSGGSTLSTAHLKSREACIAAVEAKYSLLGCKPRGETEARREFLSDLADELPKDYDWNTLFPSRNTDVEKDDQARYCQALKDWRRQFDDGIGRPGQECGEGEELIDYKNYVALMDQLTDRDKLEDAYKNLLEAAKMHALALV